MRNRAVKAGYFLHGILYLFAIYKLADIILVRTDNMKDSIYIYSDVRGLGEFFWNSCPVCGCVSVRTTFWEDGSVEQSECMTCTRMSEVMELEELFSKAAR
jgi:hypothetical protein